MRRNAYLLQFWKVQINLAIDQNLHSVNIDNKFSTIYNLQTKTERLQKRPIKYESSLCKCFKMQQEKQNGFVLWKTKSFILDVQKIQL